MPFYSPSPITQQTRENAFSFFCKGVREGEGEGEEEKDERVEQDL